MLTIINSLLFLLVSSSGVLEVHLTESSFTITRCNWQYHQYINECLQTLFSNYTSWALQNSKQCHLLKWCLSWILCANTLPRFPQTKIFLVDLWAEMTSLEHVLSKEGEYLKIAATNHRVKTGKIDITITQLLVRTGFQKLHIFESNFFVIALKQCGNTFARSLVS